MSVELNKAKRQACIRAIAMALAKGAKRDDLERHAKVGRLVIGRALPERYGEKKREVLMVRCVLHEEHRELGWDGPVYNVRAGCDMRAATLLALGEEPAGHRLYRVSVTTVPPNWVKLATRLEVA